MLDKRQVEAIKFVIAENKRILDLLASAVAASAGLQEVIHSHQLMNVDAITLDLGERMELIRMQNDQLHSEHYAQMFPRIVEKFSASGNRGRAVSPAPAPYDDEEIAA